MDGADKIIEIFLVVGAALTLFGVLYALSEKEDHAAEQERLQLRAEREEARVRRLFADHHEAEQKLRVLMPSVDNHHINFDYLSRKIEGLNKLATEETRPERELQRQKIRTKIIKNIVKEIKESKYTLLARHEHRFSDEELYCPAWQGSKDVVKIRDYEVNLAQRTCTCDYMQTIDDSIAFEDVRRVCRHQVEAATDFDKGWVRKIDLLKSNYSGEILTKVWRERFYARLVIPEMGTFLIGYNLPLDWVSIWVGDDYKYSYSLLEKRWAYGDSPRPHTDPARQAILDYFELSAFRKR